MIPDRDEDSWCCGRPETYKIHALWLNLDVSEKKVNLSRGHSIAEKGFDTSL